LAVADAAAALAGVRWGRHLYATWGGNKSLEGSLAFLSASLLCSLLALLILTDLTVAHAALISTLISTVATLVEAVAGKGIDNFLLPILGFLLVRTLLGWNEPALLASLLLTMLLAGALVRSVLRHWRRAV
jgi:phytol kinase